MQIQHSFEQIAKTLEALYPKRNHIEHNELFNQFDLKAEALFRDWSGLSILNTLKIISDSSIRKNLEKSKGLNLSTPQNTPFTLKMMSKDEMINGFSKLNINYQYAETLFGLSLIASTEIGICFLGFLSDKELLFEDMKKRFQKAKFEEQSNHHIELVKEYFENHCQTEKEITLHLNGTDFQRRVWQAFLQVPIGSLLSYAQIGEAIGSPLASRAVGTAVGSNPISYIIPCHRVVRSSGELGGYHWGAGRKKAMLAWELTRNYNK